MGLNAGAEIVHVGVVAAVVGGVHPADGPVCLVPQVSPGPAEHVRSSGADAGMSWSCLRSHQYEWSSPCGTPYRVV